jgi:hypothetical protein
MRIFAIIVATLLVASPALVARAGNGCSDSACGGGVHCPRCQGTCELSVSKEEVKKHCWDVECKTICIPRITFPWQKCGDCGTCCGGHCGLGKSGDKDADPDCNLDCLKAGGAQACGAARCARAKTVRTLKKVEYSCPQCKYKWTPADHKRCDGGCQDKANAAVSEGEPEVAPPPPPASARRIYGKPLVERTAARSE